MGGRLLNCMELESWISSAVWDLRSQWKGVSVALLERIQRRKKKQWRKFHLPLIQLMLFLSLHNFMDLLLANMLLLSVDSLITMIPICWICFVWLSCHVDVIENSNGQPFGRDSYIFCFKILQAHQFSLLFPLGGIGARVGNKRREEWASWNNAKEYKMGIGSLLYFKICKHNEVLGQWTTEQKIPPKHKTLEFWW